MVLGVLLCPHLTRAADVALPLWSLQRITDPAVPAIVDATWPRGPVDHFILAELQEKNLRPAADADRTTLLRRVTFDLTGLPPTPEEVDAFVADGAPDGFAKVVDRLLASPRYGERWGQHWLDVARYADTAGNAPDFPVPQAHRYRDWVIQSFNDDKPYDAFIREQIAGDLVPAAAGEDPRAADERIIATGYLAVGRRFGMLGDAGADHLELEDVIDTLGRSVVGLSLACARCHDHKFDPVSTEDYYALFGIFNSTRFPFPGAEGATAQKHFAPLPNSGGGDAYAVGEAETRADVKVQRGGNPKQLGDDVPRRFLHALGGHTLPAGTTASGRLELAGWLTDPATCPPTARVMVNRIWQHHFGRGIVATPNDFGTRGSPPTHPELLDWLARRFIDSGWSVKAMHRLIVNSRTYQQASVNTGADDGFLSGTRRRRLDAEQTRDALLAVSGQLDLSPAGPQPFPPADQWGGFSQHSPFLADYAMNRRSVYLMRQRIREHPYLSLFNGPAPSASTAQRSEATTPVQALFLMNDPFVHGCAEKLAERLIGADGSAAARVTLGYRLALGRPPTMEELAEAEAAVAEFRAEAASAGVTADQQERAAWAGFARALLGCNEFVFVD
jgi:hypothetical protein